MIFSRMLVVAALFLVPIPGSLLAQEPDAPAASGLDKLDRAVRLKLSVERLDDLENIIELCQEALDEGIPDDHEAMAKQLMASTLYERALQVAGSVLQGNIDGSWMIRRKTALEDLERASEINPNDGEALLMLAQLHELPGGEDAKGREAASRAVELLKSNPERYSEALTVRAAFQQDIQARLADYDAAIEADQANTDAWRERGRTKLAMGDAEAALNDFRHLLEVDKEDVVSLQAMGEAMASLGEYDEARKTLDELIEKTPDQSVGYAIRARVRMAQGDLDAAEEDLNAAIKIDPRDLIALMMRTRLRMTLEKNDLALSDANRVLELRPGLPQAILLRSLVHSAAKDYPKAVSDLKRLLRRDEKSVEIRLQLATIYAIDGKPREAIKLFSDVLDEEPDQWEALRGRADANLSAGAHLAAIADYDKVLEIEPDDSSVLNNLAWLLATSPDENVRDGKRAIKIATKACELTGYEAPHIVSTLAAAYAETGNYDEAIKWSKKAVEKGKGEIKDQLKKELESYQRNEPWREIQETSEGNEATEPIDLQSDLGKEA